MLFPFALYCQLFWSKKIKDERDSQEQILLGVMDPSNSTLMVLVIYLESIFGRGA